MSAWPRARWLCLALWLLPQLVRSDGGVPVLREVRGPLVVTVLAEPVPLRAGPVVFHTLVQANASGDPLLAGEVWLRLSGPEAGVFELEASSEGSENRLFRSAELTLPSAGSWQLDLSVTPPGASAEVFTGSFEVAPPRSRVGRFWPFIAAAPLGVALLAAHQFLSLARKGARSRKPHPQHSR